MPEYYTTKPIECLTMALESIQGLYNEKRIEDRETYRFVQIVEERRGGKR